VLKVNGLSQHSAHLYTKEEIKRAVHFQEQFYKMEVNRAILKTNRVLGMALFTKISSVVHWLVSLRIVIKIERLLVAINASLSSLFRII
jgi:hypothetical protein